MKVIAAPLALLLLPLAASEIPSSGTCASLPFALPFEPQKQYV